MIKIKIKPKQSLYLYAQWWYAGQELEVEVFTEDLQDIAEQLSKSKSKTKKKKDK